MMCRFQVPILILISACAAAAAQSYLAEMAPAHDRGLYLGILNSLWVCLV